VAIVLQSIKKTPVLERGFTYSDLHLDIEYKYLVNNELHKIPEISDVVVDYDLGAIRNSLINLFLTMPGQKILNPVFGLNLAQFLFRPCDEDTAYLIGKQIQSGITRFEPRVLLTLIRVIPDIPNQSYNVTLNITVPTLNNSSFQLVGTLSNSGFYFNT
jgi:phage baseplate assembly protein W